ncbi:MAG TPA: right-handed parallel beta-helix repeat-containing protein [Planctomycetota bacterium]|jgi:hypothetical protein
MKQPEKSSSDNSLLLTGLMVAALTPGIVAAGEPPRKAELRVGIDEGDLRGADNRVLQAAIDQLAALGGGTVRVGAGRYTLRNALTLRSNVSVLGEPGKTVLAVCDSVNSPLVCDGDCNERQVTLQQPQGFRVGDGVLVKDKRFGGGFCVTTATLTEQVNENTFRISAPLYLDYMVDQKATAALVFPGIAAYDVHDAMIEGLTIDGNREKTVHTDGCRSGGIYFFQCKNMTVRNCVVKNYNGDGVSFQVSEDVVVEDSLFEGNAGLGLHPGSGSQRPTVRRNKSVSNAGDGMFVCWRVRHGLFEKNELRGNAGFGISIGHKDSDNVFRENLIVSNAKAGVFFREESEPMGAHRNVFEKNTIVDNNSSGGEKAAVIAIHGHHYGVIFRENTIGNTQAGGPAAIGILTGKFAKDLVSEKNKFANLQKENVQE